MHEGLKISNINEFQLAFVLETDVKYLKVWQNINTLSVFSQKK